MIRLAGRAAGLAADPRRPLAPARSSNVLLARDGTCKIGDVGLARSLASKAWLTNAMTLGTFAVSGGSGRAGRHAISVAASRRAWPWSRPS